jgi:hypothetical protein
MVWFMGLFGVYEIMFIFEVRDRNVFGIFPFKFIFFKGPVVVRIIDNS